MIVRLAPSLDAWSVGIAGRAEWDEDALGV